MKSQRQRNDELVTQVLSGITRMVGADMLLTSDQTEDTVAAAHEIMKSVIRDLSDAIDVFDTVQPEA